MQTENLSLNKILTIFGGTSCILRDWFIYNDVKYHVAVISTNPLKDFKQNIFNDGKSDFVVNYFSGQHNGFLRKINK